MSFPPYRNYKSSQVEWLEEVPEHWEIKAIGAISSLKGRLGWQGLKADEYTDEGPYVVSSAHFADHRVQWDQCPKVSQDRYDIDVNIQLSEGDVLLMKDGAAMGKLAFIDSLPGAACLNSHLLLFRPASISGEPSYHPEFLFYYMQTSLFQEHIKVRGTGATFLGVSQETIGRYRLALPPLDEQKAIAAFLNSETDKIDALVEEQLQLIELLKEKRQAVISHAVTKGLDPNARMKPSGVEWLGDVPEHWTVLPVRRLTQEHRQGYYSNEGYVDDGVPLLRITDLREEGGVDYADCPRVNCTKELAEFYLRENDFVFARTGGAGTFGWIRHLTEPTAYASYLIRFRFVSSANPEFMRFYFDADPFQKALAQVIHGGVNQNVHAEDIKNQVMALPPLAEQALIAAELAEQTSAFAQLMQAASLGISLLQERRASLISAAVTGGLDVRNDPAAGMEAG